MAFHARLSASSAKRFIHCAGSVEMIDRLPKSMKRPSGFPALQGTAAHGLGEYCLVNKLESSRGLLDGWVGLDANEDAVVHPPVGEGWTPDQAPVFETKEDSELAQLFFKHVFPIDDDMCDAVDVYLQVCREILAELPGAEMLVERTFNMDWLRPNLGGTSDNTIWQFMGWLVVIDYKHGQGVAVEVEDNDQMLQYALGMAHEVEWLFDKLKLVIVQPRCPHTGGGVRIWETTKERLREHQVTLANAVDNVELARKDPENHLKAGDWCTFCDVKALCPEFTKQVQALAHMDFSDVAEDLEPITVGDPVEEAALIRLGKILEWKPRIDAFLRSADTLAAQMLAQGKSVPGQKLVEKRANRKYIVGEEIIVAEMKKLGYGVDRTHDKPKLRSPAQLEKIGKDVKSLVNGVWDDGLNEGRGGWKVEPFAAKGRGGITMAPESDPREAVSFTPGDDFGDIEEDAGE